MSANDLCYQVGATLVTIGTATPVQFVPGRCVLETQVKWASGGTLALIQGAGLSSAQGYVLGTTEVVPIKGPATFFMAAGGATAIAAVMIKYSSGYSLTP